MQFPSSSWTLITGAADREAPRFRESWERLARLYWNPVYACIRARTGRAPEEARDLTQEFFLELFEKDTLARFDASRARFRTFVKAVLDNFLSNELRARKAAKRGGGRAPLSLDADPALEERIAAAGGSPPGALLDAEWTRATLSRSLAAVESSLSKEGRPERYAAYRRCVLEAAPQREASASLGLTEAQVTNFIGEVRRRLREVLLAELMETVTCREEAEAELKELFGI
ncbi:MAG: hypothetical protein FD180_707 [Planctomycetota bacterium]|nr:MAG: hypothetical protein FD180_707 [Planctomycetota bacterium]